MRLRTQKRVIRCIDKLVGSNEYQNCRDVESAKDTYQHILGLLEEEASPTPFAEHQPESSTNYDAVVRGIVNQARDAITLQDCRKLRLALTAVMGQAIAETYDEIVRITLHSKPVTDRTVIKRAFEAALKRNRTLEEALKIRV